ncbi:MAG: hypothetical protein EOO88_18995 [Pedobacter sp.]|nr:MAG: hypothetical protein EOO88_18995 [Pedobacter sp.]
MKKLMLPLLLFLLHASLFGQDMKKTTVAQHYKTSSFDVAIFPKESLDMIPGTRFTPTKEEVLIAENLLATQLKKMNTHLENQHNSPVIHKNLKKYQRQYFGYFDSKGHKILFINSFWKDEVYADWLDGRIMVLDGGSYYWQICIDLNSRKLFDFYINGIG